MGKYTRNCGSDNLGAVMESEIENSGSAKRRKISNGELRLCSSKPIGFNGFESDDVSGDQAASCCSSNGSITPSVNCVDLEVETGTVRRESSPTSTLKEEEESSKMESKLPETTSTITESRLTIPKEKIPPAAEIEEFFAKAEEDLQKRLKHKYNYDFVKDIPLKGRFEWEKLKP